jgi:ubiquinone/menaquinone biosynthesis C-methylase UbiE
MTVESGSWDCHYTTARSELLYPDENLVRLLARTTAVMGDRTACTAVDLGCGSGRHLKLLFELGLSRIIGLDASHGALLLSRKSGGSMLVRGDNMSLPLKNETADIIIAWGSLHYNNKTDLPVMLSEIARILKPGGHLLATLRSSRDTFMKKGKHLGNDTWVTDLRDISGSIASFYNEDELRNELYIFSERAYGLMERTLIGDLASLISHWIIDARK